LTCLIFDFVRVGILICREKDLGFRDEAAKPIIEQFQKENPPIFAEFDLYATEEEKAIQSQKLADREKIKQQFVVLGKDAGLINCKIR